MGDITWLSYWQGKKSTPFESQKPSLEESRKVIYILYVNAFQWMCLQSVYHIQYKSTKILPKLSIFIIIICLNYIWFMRFRLFHLRWKLVLANFKHIFKGIGGVTLKLSFTWSLYTFKTLKNLWSPILTVIFIYL